MRTLTPFRIAVPLLAVLLVLPACGSDDEPAAAGRTVRLTEADTGSTLSLRPGDQIELTLESNVTTGFAWQLETEPASEIVDVLGSDYEAPDTELVGAGGQEVWRFAATGEGTTELALRYAMSSGETAGEPFALTVVVQPAA